MASSAQVAARLLQPLDNLVHVPRACAHEVDGVSDAVDLHDVHHDLGEHQVAPEEHWPPIVVGHGRVHQRVASDEGDQIVAQRLRVLHTGAWPGLVLVQLIGGHWQPGGLRRLLLLELAVEGLLDGVQREGANSRAGETVVGGGEHGVELALVVGITVDALCLWIGIHY